VVPQAVERSTYVLFASSALALLFWQWRPMPSVVWSVQSPVLVGLLRGLAVAGGLIAAAASLLIDHAGLFGLTPARELPFKTPGLYKYVRHPIYLGSLLVFWPVAHMTVGHLLFSSVMTAYMFIGVYFEERDLVRTFGASYEEYQRKVPMILPLIGADKAGWRVSDP
jgi:protein-S-isoprenylcysteine O-methyltransferase Ste14